MNLHAIASRAVAAVNPMTAVTVRLSTGTSEIQGDGTRIPTYQNVSARAQIQSLTYRDLQQIDGLNLQGTRRAIYIDGDVDGVVRSQIKGGDLVVFPNGTVWLVAQQLEGWPDWCKVAVTLQND